jgi:transposase
MDTRKPYPSDVSDEECAFSWLRTSRSSGKTHPNARVRAARGLQRTLRWIVRIGSAWRYMPHDLPAWETVYQQTQQWIKAGVFEEMVHDLCACFCDFRKAGRQTLRRPYSTPRALSEIHPGERATGRLPYGHKGKKGSKIRAAVDTLGHLLTLLRVSPAKTSTSAER